mmetsp:Transcript_65238/g.170887  ORF Transcript_65238/g.170887 Transcript_65238/m.170887 type:complete len:225 (+) Transcript_65238:788-1462(+)
MRRKICSMKTPISVLKCSLKLVVSITKMLRDRPNILGMEDTLFLISEMHRSLLMTAMKGSLELKTGPQFCSMPSASSSDIFLDLTPRVSACPGGRSFMLSLHRYEKTRRASRWYGFDALSPCSVSVRSIISSVVLITEGSCSSDTQLMARDGVSPAVTEASVVVSNIDTSVSAFSFSGESGMGGATGLRSSSFCGPKCASTRPMRSRFLYLQARPQTGSFVSTQ